MAAPSNKMAAPLRWLRGALSQPVGGFQAPTRVVIARPSAPPPRPTPTHPGAPQAGAGPAPGGASLAQVISGLVGQLLMQPLVLDPGPAPQAGVRVADGVDITRTNVEFLREQFNRIALHVLRCTDGSFGPRLLELCNRGLFECLALNLHCLRGERGALGALISDRIRRLSADVPPSLVGWLTAVVGLRLQAVLEQMPVTPEQVLPYVRHLGEPPEPPPRQPLPEEPMEVQEAEPPPDDAQ
ncbi:PREDICTED: large proline-rich protein BAG6, partial [Sturnus vulgaris]|uniref:large proline-rich protein BAG6 n=1 Tax=Sturnus vulgaris TaxID=9172 RepID=UPI00071A228B